MSAPKMSLYEVGLEALQIEELLTVSEGELTPELEERWNHLLTAGKDKVEAAAKVVKSLEAEANVCAEEAKRLNERARSILGNADRLKERIKIAVDLAFGGKVKTPLFTVWTQTSAPVTSYELAAEVSMDTFAVAFPNLVRQTVELNKSALKDAESLPDCVVTTTRQGTTFLRIK